MSQGLESTFVRAVHVSRRHGAEQIARPKQITQRGRVGLDVQGGVEAYLCDAKLVLGAGALTVFGQSELPALVAIALALGEHGAALRGLGEVPGFTDAAEKAFTAYPASLAFSRVLAQLDDATRGSDPARVDVAAVLRKSQAFRGVALSALESLAGDRP